MPRARCTSIKQPRRLQSSEMPSRQSSRTFLPLCSLRPPRAKKVKRESADFSKSWTGLQKAPASTELGCQSLVGIRSPSRQFYSQVLHIRSSWKYRKPYEGDSRRIEKQQRDYVTPCVRHGPRLFALAVVKTSRCYHTILEMQESGSDCPASPSRESQRAEGHRKDYPENPLRGNVLRMWKKRAEFKCGVLTEYRHFNCLCGASRFKVGASRSPPTDRLKSIYIYICCTTSHASEISCLHSGTHKVRDACA